MLYRYRMEVYLLAAARDFCAAVLSKNKLALFEKSVHYGSLALGESVKVFKRGGVHPLTASAMQCLATIDVCRANGVDDWAPLYTRMAVGLGKRVKHELGVGQYLILRDSAEQYHPDVWAEIDED